MCSLHLYLVRKVRWAFQTVSTFCLFLTGCLKQNFHLHTLADQQKIMWKDPIISVSTLPQKAPGGEKKVLEELLSAKKTLSYLQSCTKFATYPFPLKKERPHQGKENYTDLSTLMHLCSHPDPTASWQWSAQSIKVSFSLMQYYLYHYHYQSPSAMIIAKVRCNHCTAVWLCIRQVIWDPIWYPKVKKSQVDIWNYCDFASSWVRSLKSHLRTHSGKINQIQP